MDMAAEKVVGHKVSKKNAISPDSVPKRLERSLFVTASKAPQEVRTNGQTDSSSSKRIGGGAIRRTITAGFMALTLATAPVLLAQNDTKQDSTSRKPKMEFVQNTRADYTKNLTTNETAPAPSPAPTTVAPAPFPLSELNGFYQAGRPFLVLQRGKTESYYPFDATNALKSIKLDSISEGSLLYRFASPEGNLLRFLILSPGGYGSISATVRLGSDSGATCRFSSCETKTPFEFTEEKRVFDFPDKTGMVILTGSWVSVLRADLSVSFDLTRFLKENGLDSNAKISIDFQPGYVVIGIPGKDGKLHQYGVSLSDGFLYAGG
jgi:hypothetical protein